MAGIEDGYPSFYDGTDVFVEFFFKTLPEAKDHDFGTRSDLGEAIERWERNRAQEESEDEDNNGITPGEEFNVGGDDSSADERPDVQGAE